MAGEATYPSFEDFVKRGKDLERNLITVEARNAQAYDENSIVEYKVGEEKTYPNLLSEVERLRKVVAATYYSERLSEGKEAPLPQSFVEKKKIAEKKAKPLERKEEKKEAKTEKRVAVAVKAEGETDFDAVLEGIGAMDDSLLADFAKKNAPDLYKNFDMGGMTAVEFRMAVRELIAKKAGVPEEKIEEWSVRW